MSQKFRILQEYHGFEIGDIITVASPTRLADMARGIGEPYVEPEPEAKSKKPVEKKADKPKKAAATEKAKPAAKPKPGKADVEKTAETGDGSKSEPETGQTKEKSGDVKPDKTETKTADKTADQSKEKPEKSADEK